MTKLQNFRYKAKILAACGDTQKMQIIQAVEEDLALPAESLTLQNREVSVKRKQNRLYQFR